MKRLIVPIKKEIDLPDHRVLYIELNPETQKLIYELFGLVLQDVEMKQKEGIITPSAVMYEAPNGHLFSYMELALNAVTLPNGDMIGNFLRRNGYCFLPEQVRIPPMDHVEVDFVIDVIDHEIYFVVRGGHFIRTLPIKSKILE